MSKRRWLERASRDKACILPDAPMSAMLRPAAARTDDCSISKPKIQTFDYLANAAQQKLLIVKSLFVTHELKRPIHR